MSHSVTIRVLWLVAATPVLAPAQGETVDPGTTLIGMLLLTDFTILKVMLSAVVVGMIGIHCMHAAGLVKLHIKPTRYASNTFGGLLFGVGFALAAYCPGTSPVALGQGNYDALAVMLGLDCSRDQPLG